MKRMFQWALGAALGLVPVAGWAQDRLSLDPATAPEPAVTLDAAAAPAPANPWHLSLELPLWVPSLNGTAGVHGFRTPVDAAFTDILQKSDSLMGVLGRVEAGYGPLTFVVDGVYMKIGANASAGGAALDFKAELALVDADLFYRVGTWNLGAAQPQAADTPRLSLDVGPGLRYMHVGLQINTVGGPGREQNQDWVIPVAATQLFLDLDRHWQIVSRDDVGGGVTNNFTWSAALLLRYRFLLSASVSAAVELGYKAVGEDFHHGSGTDEFTWDAVLHGPVLGFAVDF